MADEKELKQARAVFETLCRTFDERKLHYEKDEEKLSISCAAQGDDLPMEITINVDAGRRLLVLLSHLPVITPENKRVDVAMAVSAVNNVLIDGNFDYDIRNGHLFFRLTSSFCESLIGSEALEYMLFCAFQTIDMFNDKFLMLAKGMMTFGQFIETLTNNERRKDNG